MKRVSTHFLRFTLIILGLGVLALCIFALPSMWSGGPVEYPRAAYAIFLIMIGMYITAVPFFIALWQTFLLLGYIDAGKAFSELSVEALRNIKHCATVITIFYIGFIPLYFPIADADDAPGLVVMGAAMAGAPVVITVFAAVLERLLKNAIDIKSENDLTV